MHENLRLQAARCRRMVAEVAIVVRALNDAGSRATSVGALDRDRGAFGPDAMPAPIRGPGVRPTGYAKYRHQAEQSMSETEIIHLAADLSHYHTDYLWKMPGSWEGYPYYSSPEFYEDIARIAARGDHGHAVLRRFRRHARRTTAAIITPRCAMAAKWPRHDMMPMIPCMSRVGGRASVSASPCRPPITIPFHIARTFNALDHVTKGRIAWNAVTSRSKNEAANWGYKKMIEHDVRYDRRRSICSVCCALWDSVEPDAIMLDRETGIFGDPGQGASPQFRGRVLQRARTVARAAVAAGPPGHHPGRTVRPGHGPRRPLRRPAVQHAAHDGRA